MALDLLFRKKNNRDWSRSSTLTSLPPAALAPTPTVIDDALERARSLNPGLAFKRSGRGGVVSKTVKF